MAALAAAKIGVLDPSNNRNGCLAQGSSSDLSNYAQKDFSSTGIIGGMVTFLFLIYDSFQAIKDYCGHDKQQ